MAILRREGPGALIGRLTQRVLPGAHARSLWKRAVQGWLDAERLPAYAERHGRLWTAPPEPSIHYRTPEKSGVPPSFRRYTTSHTPIPRYLAALPDGMLAGPHALGFTADNQLLLDTFGGRKDHFLAQQGHDITPLLAALSHRLFPRTPPTLPGEAVLPLVPMYPWYYYHWVLEYLPKLRLLNRYEADTNRAVSLLIPADAPAFIPDTLTLLGYDSERHIEWQGEVATADPLLVSTHRLSGDITFGFRHSRSDYQWLRKRLRHAVGASDASAHRKIYVSRQSSSRRRVLNFDALATELKDRGFDIIAFESLSMKDQIRLAAETDVWMGPHGAGLVNMIFSNPSMVIELQSQAVFDWNVALHPHFYLLADLLEAQYTCIITDAEDPDPPTRNDARAQNMIVDLDYVREQLDMLGL